MQKRFIIFCALAVLIVVPMIANAENQSKNPFDLVWESISKIQSQVDSFFDVFVSRNEFQLAVGTLDMQIVQVSNECVAIKSDYEDTVGILMAEIDDLKSRVFAIENDEEICSEDSSDFNGFITCGVGECQMSVPVCGNSSPEGICVPGEPIEEIEDGKDNDCDGQVDEDFYTPPTLPSDGVPSDEEVPGDGCINEEECGEDEVPIIVIEL